MPAKKTALHKFIRFLLLLAVGLVLACVLLEVVMRISH